MPVFNGEAYVEASLRSLLAQTFDDFELIISDNASTDRTAQICQDYGARDPRIRFYRNDRNLGVVANEDRVVRLARAGFFRYAASDDLCAPTHLERCYEILRQHPEAVLCYPQARLIDEQAQPLEDYDEGLDLQEAEPHKRLAHLLRRINMCNAPFGLIRTSAFQQLGKLSNFPSYDVVYLAHLSLLGKFIEIPERLFFRRVYPSRPFNRRLTIHQRTVMMNTELSGKIIFPYWILLRSFINVIGRAPIDLKERAICYAMLLVWVRRYGWSLYWDLRIFITQLLTGERFVNDPSMPI
jgi:glycosyltransferase involved in cell wall biosynthesis